MYHDRPLPSGDDVRWEEMHMHSGGKAAGPVTDNDLAKFVRQTHYFKSP
jgi:hypothetical protein